jgi:hypothetical protein
MAWFSKEADLYFRTKYTWEFCLLFSEQFNYLFLRNKAIVLCTRNIQHKSFECMNYGGYNFIFFQKNINNNSEFNLAWGVGNLKRKQRCCRVLSLVFTRFLKIRSIGPGLFMTKKIIGHESLSLPIAMCILEFVILCNRGWQIWTVTIMNMDMAESNGKC